MKLSELLIENKLDQAIEKYGSTVNSAVISQLYAWDPSETKKYFNWMVGELAKDPTVSPSKIANLIQTFHQNINKITSQNIQSADVSDRVKSSPKDINSYSLPDLGKVVQTILNVKSKTEVKREGADVIYEDERWLALVPLTAQASCYYGSGTKWCTAARNGNQFNNYNQRGFLIYFLDKSRSEGSFYKMALSVVFNNRGDADKTWYDEEDHTFRENITQLLPSELISTVNQYLKTKSDEIRKSNRTYTIQEIQKLLIDELVKRKKIKTPYGDFIIDYDGELVFLNLTNDGLKKFPDMTYFVVTATPFYEDSLEIPYDISIEFKGASRDIEYHTTQKFGTNEVRILIEPGNKTDQYVRNQVLDLAQRYGNYFKSVVRQVIVENNIEITGARWTPKNGVSTMSFRYPPGKGTMTDMFIKYVVRRQRRGLPATKRHFYQTVLGYKITLGKLSYDEFIKIIDPPDYLVQSSDKDKTIKNHFKDRYYNPISKHQINISGHNTQFFAGVAQSGILKRDGQFYTLGPNYDAWTKGELIRG